MRLCLYSFLILFFEFALIRYIPAHVKATSYFANLTIIATFLGMGIGAILSRRRRFDFSVAAFPFLLYLLFGQELLVGQLVVLVVHLPLLEELAGVSWSPKD